MAFNNTFSGLSANQMPPPSTSQSLEGASQVPTGYSQQFGQFSNANELMTDSPDGKQGLKRKRSIADAAHRHTSEESYTDDGPAHRGGQSGHFQSGNQSKAAATAAQDVKKRTKTQRACDKCRTKKIRCAAISLLNTSNPGNKKLSHTGATFCLTLTHRCARTASSTTTTVPSSYPSKKPGSRKRSKKKKTLCRTIRMHAVSRLARPLIVRNSVQRSKHLASITSCHAPNLSCRVYRSYFNPIPHQFDGNSSAPTRKACPSPSHCMERCFGRRRLYQSRATSSSSARIHFG